MEKLYTVNELCEYLKIKRSITLRWIRTGRLRAFKLGGGRLWRIRERDLVNFIKGGGDEHERPDGNTGNNGAGRVRGTL